MISKIICPTDFSETANNAMEYAVKIACKTGAELVLRNVQSISSFEIVPPKIWAESEKKVIAEKLESTCTEINKVFKILCTFDIELTHPTLVNAITKKVAATDMIIMGTNGVDSWHQFLGGTNTYHVTQKAICPVMVIPENIPYKDIEKIVFAWDGTRESMLSFMQLENLVSVFHSKITVVNVNKHHKENFEETFIDLQNEWKGKFSEIHFEKIYNNDVIESLKEYMRTSDSDLLIMVSHQHGVIYNFFQNSVTRVLTEDAIHPLFKL